MREEIDLNNLEYCFTKIIEVNNQCYAFDTLNYKIVPLNQDEKAVFLYLIEHKQFPKDEKLAKAVFKILLLIKKGYFFSENEYKIVPVIDRERYIISFPIVHSCNMRCKYCFADGGHIYKGQQKEMSAPVIKEIVQFIRKQSNDKVKNIRLEFVSGGETLLLKEKYKECITLLQNEVKKYNINLEVFTVTNGTVLDEDIIQFINEHNISLGISIDGKKEVHDSQRVLADGRGTYDLIIKNIEQFIQNRQENNLWVVSVVTSKTKSLVDILKHNLSIGTETAEMRVVRGKDKYGLALSGDNLNHFIKMYDELILYLKSNLDDVKIILNRYDTLGKLIVRLLLNQLISFRCQSAKTKFTFTADGDIYPCDSFVGHSQFLIGNVLTGEYHEDVVKEFEENSVNHNEECKLCPYKYLCGGDCYYNVYKVKNSEDCDIFCKLQRHLCELAIDFVGELEINNPEKYKELKRFARIRELN